MVNATAHVPHRDAVKVSHPGLQAVTMVAKKLANSL
jgi:hypothetical protein